MDGIDHPMENSGDSSPLISSNLGGNSLDSKIPDAARREVIFSNMSSRHTRTASGPTVSPNISAAEETPQQSAQDDVSLQSISASLQSIEETAPPLTQTQINRNRSQQVKAAFDQKRADYAAAKAEKERVELQASMKAPLPNPVQPAGQSHKPTQPAPAPRDPFPFTKIDHVKGSLCCISHDIVGPIAGHFKDNTGVKVMVKVEGGKTGNPCLSLSFTCNIKADPKDSKVSSVPEETQTATLRFRPGVPSSKIPGKFTIERYHEQYLSTLAQTDTSVHRPEILEAIGSLNQQQASHVRVFRFQYNDFEFDPLDASAAKIWKQYKGNKVYDVLKKILSAVPGVITIWSVIEARKEGHKVNFEAFKRATVQNLQPYFQYYLPDDPLKPVIDLEKTETIHTIGKGMYITYDKDKQGNLTDKIIGYSAHPAMTSWNTEAEFKIWHSMTPIREFYHSKGLAVYKESQLLSTLLVKGHTFGATRIDNLKAEGQLSEFQERYFAYVRMPSRNSVESPPAEGQTVKLDWDLATLHTKHESQKKNLWFGQIIRADPQILKDTNTNFCVMLVKPPGATPKKAHEELALYHDRDLHKCYIKIDVSDDVIVSELIAIEKFLASDHPVVRRIRERLMSPTWIDYPLAEYVNLAEGPPSDDPVEKMNRVDVYDRHTKRVEQANDNASQVAIIKKAKNTAPLIITAGPPGTGKSKSIADQFWALIAVLHIIVVVANNNASLDETLNKVFSQRPEEFKDTVVVREETTTVADRLTRQQGLEWSSQYMGLKPEEVNQLPDPEEKWDELPAYVVAMEKAMAEDSPEQWETFDKQAALYQKTFEAFQEAEGGKRYGTSVVTEATMGWHIWKLCQEMTAKAQKDYNDDVARAETQYKNDPPALAKFMRDLKSVEERDDSTDYRDHRRYYVSVGGRVSHTFRTVYDAHRIQMENRVLAKARGIFVPASNSVSVAARKDEEGGQLVKPTVLIAEESGTLTTAALAVPLTAFSTWLALYMVGDHEQLHPTLLARQLNEMRETAKISVLENLIVKGCPFHLLNQQYRMNPELSQFPNEFFYGNRIQDHPSTSVNNPIRNAGRTISRAYGIKGPEGNGSCFIFLDLPLSVSRVEEGGTSIVNHAHKDAIKEQVNLALQNGVPPESITVLVWYQGQRGLINREVRMIVLPDGSIVEKPIKEVSTVDAYQGKENSYLIIDFVIGSEDLKTRNVEDDAARQGPSKKFGTMTGHTKSKNRVNVALTRARDVIVCIGQAAVMIQTSIIKKVGQRENSAVAALVREAIKRRVMVRLDNFRDSHPTAVQMREQKTVAELQEEERQSAKLKFDHVNTTLFRHQDPKAKMHSYQPPNLKQRAPAPFNKKREIDSEEQREKKKVKKIAKDARRAGGHTGCRRDD